MTAESVLPPPFPYRDASARMIVVGIVQIVVGVLFFLFAMLVLFAVILAKAHNPVGSESSRGMIMLGLLNFVFCGWSVAIGVGSILKRRWARSLTLASSWLLCALIIFSIFHFGSSTIEQAGSPTVHRVTPQKVFAVKLAAVCVGAIFIGLLSGKNVKDTCEAYNPNASWTDKCPMPVLIASLDFGVKIFSVLGLLIWGIRLPFLGHPPSALVQNIVLVLCAIVCAYSAVGIYQLKRHALWFGLAVALVLGGAGSNPAAIIAVTYLVFVYWFYFRTEKLLQV